MDFYKKKEGLEDILYFGNPLGDESMQFINAK
jgi:hypothetical protein